MIRKFFSLIFVGLLILNLCGCVAVVAGAAGGGGTAFWLSGKLSQEVNAPFERAVKASKSALGSLRLRVTKETVEQNIAQIKSEYTDGKTIWIDVRRVTQGSSKIEVRVGAVKGDKEAAEKILKRITQYL